MAGRFVNPNAFTNAFNTQVQLGAQMRQADQAEEMNALSLERMRRENNAMKQPQYDAQAFPKVGAIAAQISSIQDPAQKRTAFKTAILQNGALFDTMGMPHADAIAKLDAIDDAGLDATLAKLASFAPKAAPTEVTAGNSLVTPKAGGGFETAYTAPSKAESEGSPFAKINPADYTSTSVAKFKQTGNEGDLVPREKPADPNAGFDTAAKLRGEFNNQSKEFRGVADSYQRIVDSASNPSAAGDLSLIFNYMKVLDPGSTVREGEFATAQQAGSVPSRIIAQYNKLLSGERLSEAQRADFVDRATKLYKGQESRYKSNVFDRYEGLARRYGVDPREVTTDVNAAVPPPGGGGGGGAAPVRVNTPAEAAKLPPGTVFITPDGRRKVVPGG